MNNIRPFGHVTIGMYPLPIAQVIILNNRQTEENAPAVNAVQDKKLQDPNRQTKERAARGGIVGPGNNNLLDKNDLPDSVVLRHEIAHHRARFYKDVAAQSTNKTYSKVSFDCSAKTFR